MAYESPCGKILTAIYPGLRWPYAWSIRQKQEGEATPYDLSGTFLLRLMSGTVVLAESTMILEDPMLFGEFTAEQTATISVATPSPTLVMVHNDLVLWSRRVDIQSAGAV